VSVDRISPPEEYPGPEGSARARVELENLPDVQVLGYATLVPPAAVGRPAATIRTGCYLPMLGEVYVDIDFAALAEWVDAVRAERRRLGVVDEPGDFACDCDTTPAAGGWPHKSTCPAWSAS